MPADVCNPFLKKHANANINLGTDKVVKHSYGFVYDRIWEHLALESKRADVMEFGVWSGKSLLAWADTRDFLGLDGEVNGMEIDLSHLVEEVKKDQRVLVHEADCRDESRIPGRWDLIIDDASHEILDITETLSVWWKHLRKKGVYVIEDLTPVGCQAVQSMIPEDAMAEIYDLRAVRRRRIDHLDNCIVVLTKV